MICVDEKPSIQALERAQGYLKLPNGRALSGQSHDYRRHGTTTLFAAFEVATGKVTSRHAKRRRRTEFLAFMDEVVATHPDQELHVILDNLNTHKYNDDWLARHPKVRFHFTPTRGILAQPGRDLVLDPRGAVPARRLLQFRRTTDRPHRRIHRRLQPTRRPLRLDQGHRPPKPFKGRRFSQL